MRCLTHVAAGLGILGVKVPGRGALGIVRRVRDALTTDVLDAECLLTGVHLADVLEALEHPGADLGSFPVRPARDRVQLEELIVEESARGLNLGRVLVQRTIDDARRRGCAEMGLYLVPRTEGNRGFYEKLGFEVLGTEMRQTFT